MTTNLVPAVPTGQQVDENHSAWFMITLPSNRVHNSTDSPCSTAVPLDSWGKDPGLHNSEPRFLTIHFNIIVPSTRGHFPSGFPININQKQTKTGSHTCIKKFALTHTCTPNRYCIIGIHMHDTLHTYIRTNLYITLHTLRWAAYITYTVYIQTYYKL